MPQITNIEIDTHMVTYRGEPLWPEPVLIDGEPVDSVYKLTITADIRFEPIEIGMAMKYVVKIALYEQDDGLDIPAVHLNWDSMHIQRASVGDRDDFMGIPYAEYITADEKRKRIERTVFVLPREEADRRFEFRALVACNPVLGPALRWSPVATLPQRR